MKAISEHQPSADLIAYGYKSIETRSWQPPKGLIGSRIAIHAAKRRVKRPERDGMHSDIHDAMHEIYGGADWYKKMPYGAVVATAALDGAGLVVTRGPRFATTVSHLGGYPNYEGVRHDKFGDFSIGRWLWFLEDVQRLEKPVPARGYQGIWNWTPVTGLELGE